MKIISLLPSATEIIYFLGEINNLVGISAECDWPPQISNLPRVVKPILNTQNLTSYEIEQEIQKLLYFRGEIYEMDYDLIASLNPDIIIAQDLCKVCSITPRNFIDKLKKIVKNVKVISLNPKNVRDIIHNIVEVAEVLNIKEKGERIALSLYNEYQEIIKKANQAFQRKPRCVFIEWLNPVYIGGHWIGEILNDLKAIPIINTAGQYSRKIDIKEIANFDPDYIIISPCGRKDDVLYKETYWFIKNKYIMNTKAYKNRHIYLIPECFTTKPGPRIIEGAKIIYEILYMNSRAYCVFEKSQITHTSQNMKAEFKHFFNA